MARKIFLYPLLFQYTSADPGFSFLKLKSRREPSAFVSHFAPIPSLRHIDVDAISVLYTYREEQEPFTRRVTGFVPFISRIQRKSEDRRPTSEASPARLEIKRTSQHILKSLAISSKSP